MAVDDGSRMTHQGMTHPIAHVRHDGSCMTHQGMRGRPKKCMPVIMAKQAGNMTDEC